MWTDKMKFFSSRRIARRESLEVSSLRYRIARWIGQKISQQNSLEAKKEALEHIDDILELVTICEELRLEMKRRWLPYIPSEVDGNPHAWFQHHIYHHYRKKPSCPRTKLVRVWDKKRYVGKVFKYKRRIFIRFASFMLEALERDDRERYTQILW